ncbi:TPA: RimK family alpha-L-glutamate ligase, partial [Candidatus Poribacteria bacterium]|nr:RimK family alpha-L-glutamate ligase [Candidatus Poribacteria bacterium]
LMEAAELSGHQTQILDPFGFSLHVQNDNIRIFYNGYVAENFDLIIPRFSAATAEFGFEILSHFASLHTACIINSPDAIQNARHKFRSLRILAEHNIPILPSFTTGTTESLEQSVSYIGAEYPVIAKPFIGTHGKGIMLLDTLISLQSAIGAMCDVNRNYVVQKYVDLNSSGDVRVIVVGDKAVAGMKRVPQNGEFRSNVHRGGIGHQLIIGHELRDIAVGAVKTLNLEVAGVDLVETEGGYAVLEVNPSPGFEEIEAVTSIHVAEAIIAFAIEATKEE